ncbi:MAG TPA: MaoC/PaaZ C-terminal domain-containing protein [Anaerolineales bacterium]|jgi:3-hydroxybutyryl-CoA dehydratase|nr:MaoC/PaaZ C-terminal domain-containing protein [Anaerolineales bacterium]
MAQEMTRLFYEDLNVGDEDQSTGRTVTETDVVSFAGLSGDFNNMHIDEEFAKKTVFGTRVAHGLCVLSIASGLWFTMPRLATIAFMGLEDWRFSDAVKFGDTIHITRKLVEKREHKRPNMGFLIFEVNVHNQDNKIVQKGKWVILVQRKES